MIATIVILNTVLVVGITTAVLSLLTWGIVTDQPARRSRGERRRRRFVPRLAYAST